MANRCQFQIYKMLIKDRYQRYTAKQWRMDSTEEQCQWQIYQQFQFQVFICDLHFKVIISGGFFL